MSSNNPTLYDRAVALALARGGITNKLMQRELRISFKRARELLAEMEAKGVVGPTRSRKPREVLISREQDPSASPTAGANGAEVAPSPAANGGALSLLLAGGTTTDETFDRAVMALGLVALRSRIGEVEQRLLRPR